MNLLSNSCRQTAKKSENGKKRPTYGPRYRAPANISCIIEINLFVGVDEIHVKNITVTVSVRVSDTVRVSLNINVH